MLVGHLIPRLAGNALNWSLAGWMGEIFVMKSQWSSCKVNRSRGCHACNEAGEPCKITEAGVFATCTAARHQGATNVSSVNGAAWWMVQLERSSPWCWIQSSEEQLLLFAPVLWWTNCLISGWKIWCLFSPPMIIKPSPIPSDLCLGFLLKLCTAQDISVINKNKCTDPLKFLLGQ